MRDSLEKIASTAQSAALDSWLLFDFRCINPLALQLIGLSGKSFLTRRWFLFVPAKGTVLLEDADFSDGGAERLTESMRTSPNKVFSC